jgi:hypothetical protein
MTALTLFSLLVVIAGAYLLARRFADPVRDIAIWLFVIGIIGAVIDTFVENKNYDKMLARVCAYLLIASFSIYLGYRIAGKKK